uniref:Paneth cell-specific alpha-defensin 28 n=1 Tax=Equus caballus TaxID=9796 RepID=C8BNI1_HORSE|nr:Paneth cell-specific alpha-defensin 28 precursor [Equus caballus]ACV49754.1 Paneth cell-specific alpha-defensin 28 [Equus caballus]
MRTLALLAALLLLVLQAQTQKSEKAADQVPAQDQPGAEVQGMTISFEGDERSTRDASGSRSALICHCSFSCRSPYKKIGYCHLRRLHFCCPSWLNFVD